MTGLQLRELHPFRAAGRQFVYLVPSAAIYALDETASAILEALSKRARTREELVGELSGGIPREDIENSLGELLSIRAVGEMMAADPPPPRVTPAMPFPLTTMVLNVTNQCNLSCTYCYEYGEDKIVETNDGKKSKFMSEETARQSVEFMLKESGANRVAHLTFFGGETLLNFPVLKS